MDTGFAIKGAENLPEDFGIALVIPGSPALVQELAPSDEAAERMRTMIRKLVGSLIDGEGKVADTIEIVGSQDERWRTDHTGSFAAWGAPDTTVGEGNYLPELVARYVLSPYAERITGSRASIGTPASGVVTVVVVDGSAGLSDRAPLALVEGAGQIHEQIKDFLAGTGECPPADALASTGVIEPALWVELAELDAEVRQLIDHDDSQGVGRYVAMLMKGASA